MGTCYVLGAMYAGEWQRILRDRQRDDLILCADGGLDAAIRYGIKPDYVIGDFDSMPASHAQGYAHCTLSAHKDDTDMRACFLEGERRGYRDFVFLGGTGGRLDHTLANIQLLSECAQKGYRNCLSDDFNTMRVYAPGTYRIAGDETIYLSLIALSDRVEGITLSGTEWELHDAVLTNTYALGCSNETRAETVMLRFAKGLLGVLLCKRIQGRTDGSMA
ncbi:MAG: thiamine diphosphokinase [Clostridia bacterium]|nr:thiamine diphosphokinase [Clostridia bacterium]